MSTLQHLVVVVLLGAGVAVELLCCIGLWRMRNVFSRLHFLGPATLLGPLCIAAAVAVDGSSVQAAIKAFATALLLLVTGPVVTHATARAARVRETGDAKASPEEAAVGELKQS